MRRLKPERGAERGTILHRVLWLAGMLRRNKRFTAPTAGAVLGTEARTIKRDLRTLRDLRWRIGYDMADHTYYLIRAPRPTLI